MVLSKLYEKDCLQNDLQQNDYKKSLATDLNNKKEKIFSHEPRRSRDRLQQSWSNEHGEWQRTKSTKRKKVK